MTQAQEEAFKRVEDHLRRYWEPFPNITRLALWSIKSAVQGDTQAFALLQELDPLAPDQVRNICQYHGLELYKKETPA